MNEARFWAKVRKSEDPNGCWEWIAASQSSGYGVFGKKLAHRAGFELQCGTIATGLLVCHRCDNKKCVRGDHLFLGSHQDNSDDMVSKGRAATGDRNGNAKESVRQLKAVIGRRVMSSPERRAKYSRLMRGEGNAAAKLNADKVREIRRLRAEGHTCRSIGEMFGVTGVTVSLVCLRKLWPHVA